MKSLFKFSLIVLSMYCFNNLNSMESLKKDQEKYGAIDKEYNECIKECERKIKEKYPDWKPISSRGKSIEDIIKEFRIKSTGIDEPEPIYG